MKRREEGSEQNPDLGTEEEEAKKCEACYQRVCSRTMKSFNTFMGMFPRESWVRANNSSITSYITILLVCQMKMNLPRFPVHTFLETSIVAYFKNLTFAPVSPTPRKPIGPGGPGIPRGP